MRQLSFVVGLSAVVAVSGLLGCGSEPTPRVSDTQEAAAIHSHEGDHDHGSHDEGGSDEDKVKQNLAKLSDTDRASAEKQKLCPVSGGLLGSMGTPIKMTAKDQDVWICCNGCRKSFEEDPEKFLAQIQK